MTHKTLKICIVLPAYNEERIIKKTLAQLPKTARLQARKIKFDIVVVNDGSTDNTARQAAKVPGVLVINHLLNMGAGAATRTGLHYARERRYDFAVTMDADGQHSVNDLHKLITFIVSKPEVDLLIGSRLVDSRNMPLHKKIGNHLLSYITFLMLGVYASDSQSGLRVLSPKALRDLEFHSDGYAFCSEMLWQAKRAKLAVVEHSITAIYTTYSRAKGQRSYSGALKILQQLLLRRITELVHE